MAEKRMISKAISISEKVNIGLTDIFHMLLYTWIIPHTDDFGRLPGSPAKVKALVVPMLDKSIKDVERGLQEMHDCGLIIWYEIEGHKYIQVTNFEDHQQGLHKRTKSKIPEFPGNSRNFSEIPSEGKGREEKRTEQKGIGTEEKGTALSPSEIMNNPHENHITNLLKRYEVAMDKPFEMEQFFSYIGAVDIEVIEAAIKKSSKRGIAYCLGTLKGMLKDGVTKDSLKPKVGESNGRTGEGDTGNIVPIVPGQQKKLSQFIRRA